MFTKQHLNVLKRLYSELEANEIDWVLTGSTSFCLQGIPVNPDDIDIQTDKPGAYEIERLFRENIIEKVEFSSTGKIKSHFGVFKIEEIRVEVMGAVQKFHNDKWEDPVDIGKHKKFVYLKGMEIPVLDLTYEAEAYRKLGRLKKAKELGTYVTPCKSDNKDNSQESRPR